jgi:cation diffusion facilitator family transporter
MPQTDAAAKAERTAAIIALVVGFLLLLVKFAAYYKTGSAAIFSDALESIVNILAGGLALYSVILAHHPADREHPYGHGKIEFVSAGFEGGMIALAAVIIAARAAEKFFYGDHVQDINLGLALMAIAMFVNGALSVYLLRIGRKSQSLTLQADGKHLFTDAVTSAVVLISLFLMKLSNINWIDPLAAILVAIYITWMASGLLRQSAAGLMDEQDRADDAMLRGILDSHIGPGGKKPHICSYHKLRHRHSGRYHWVDFHIMVPGDWNIERGHRVASEIEYEIELALGEGNATAHVEPCHENECKACAANA